MAKVYPAPNTSADAPYTWAASYDHFIGGKFVPPGTSAPFSPPASVLSLCARSGGPVL
jgi:hypothetical protein